MSKQKPTTGLQSRAVDAELRHLRSFVMVAEELSFTRAAHRLHITQQSLSATIKQLETVVGGQLLVRTTRAVRLTEAGDVLLTRAREALSAADDAVSRTRAALGRLEGRVSGGLALDLAPLLNSTLDRFQDHHPAVQLALTTGLEVQLFDELSLGRLDFVVNWAPPPPELGLDHTALLAAEAFVLTHADHPLASRSAIERADLDHEPLIIFPRWVAPYSYANILRLLGDGPEAPRQVIEVPLLDSGVDAIARAVATGTGIGVVGPTAAARDLDQDLVLRHLTPPLLSPVELVWRTDGSHRTGAVVDALLASRPGAMDGPALRRFASDGGSTSHTGSATEIISALR